MISRCFLYAQTYFSRSRLSLSEKNTKSNSMSSPHFGPLMGLLPLKYGCLAGNQSCRHLSGRKGYLCERTLLQNNNRLEHPCPDYGPAPMLRAVVVSMRGRCVTGTSPFAAYLSNAVSHYSHAAAKLHVGPNGTIAQNI